MVDVNSSCHEYNVLYHFCCRAGIEKSASGMTVMNSWGRTYYPTLKKMTGTSLVADIQYQHPRLEGWEFGGSVGADTGNIMGKSTIGISLSVRKTGLLKKYQ